MQQAMTVNATVTGTSTAAAFLSAIETEMNIFESKGVLGRSLQFTNISCRSRRLWLKRNEPFPWPVRCAQDSVHGCPTTQLANCVFCAATIKASAC